MQITTTTRPTAYLLEWLKAKGLTTACVDEHMEQLELSNTNGGK